MVALSFVMRSLLTIRAAPYESRRWRDKPNLESLRYPYIPQISNAPPTISTMRCEQETLRLFVRIEKPNP